MYGYKLQVQIDIKKPHDYTQAHITAAGESGNFIIVLYFRLRQVIPRGRLSLGDFYIGFPENGIFDYIHVTRIIAVHYAR